MSARFLNYSLGKHKRASTANDLHSNKSPQAFTDVNDILFEYNASSNNKVVPLAFAYIGVDSIYYNGSITLLAPYSSIILFKTPNNNQTPVIQPPRISNK